MKNNELYEVPDWDNYYLDMLDSISKRASCSRGKSSAIIVRDKRILSTGYVGAPTGLPSCNEIGHELIQRIENISDKNLELLQTI